MINLRRLTIGTAVVATVLALTGCPGSSLLDQLNAAGSPTPGFDGIISIDSVGATTVDISWTLATDDTTAASDIEYQVYFATSDSIDTPENAAANGTAVFTAWEAARDSATIIGLSQTTSYWVVVVARDDDANMASYIPKEVTTAAPDTTGPTPGNVGTIVLGSIDQTIIDISWTAATDDTTDVVEIEYQVFYSTSANVGTAATAIANGTAVLADWTKAAVSATVSGLTRATSYWINVVARDAAANMAAYTAAATGTAEGPVIRIFDVFYATDRAESTTSDFGSVGSVATRSFEIWNDGDQTLNLAVATGSRVLLSGFVAPTETDPGFFVITQPPNEAVLPDNKETFAIQFRTDISFQTRTATVTIGSDDPTNADFIFNVSAFATC